jgi:hypothetical protein
LGDGCRDGSPAHDQQSSADCEAGRNGSSKLRAESLGQLKAGQTKHPDLEGCRKPRYVLGDTENHTKVEKDKIKGQTLNTAHWVHGGPKMVYKIISKPGGGVKIKTLKQQRRILRNRQSASVL